MAGSKKDARGLTRLESGPCSGSHAAARAPGGAKFGCVWAKPVFASREGRTEAQLTAGSKKIMPYTEVANGSSFTQLRGFVAASEPDSNWGDAGEVQARPFVAMGVSFLEAKLGGCPCRFP